MPALDRLSRPVLSRQRKAGLLVQPRLPARYVFSWNW